MKGLKHLMLAAVAVAALSASAMAETVTFTTAGLFTSGGNGVATGNSILYTSGTATTMLTFNAIGTSETINTPITSSLGMFSISSTNGGATPTNGATFTLTINQSAPVGTGVTGGTVSDEFVGKVTAVTGGFDIVLAPQTLGISGVTYQLQDLNSGVLDVGNGTNVNAKITAVPLPAAAWGGMGLLGLLGAAKARARRQLKA